ncbi:MAG: Rid family hydrolase [Minwuia sp.]|uniref:Rid family hydrolase n=1 Tax=Minwuia sp. TaxID=2493630 RepID=UPI003A89B963
MPREMIVPKGQGFAPKHFRMAPAAKANGLIWMSGVVADQREPGEEAMDAAIDKAFATIGNTLAESGSGWEHVVEIVSYHTDLAGSIQTFMAVKDRYLTGPDFPAWTAIGTTALAIPTGIVEIKITATEA